MNKHHFIRGLNMLRAFNASGIHVIRAFKNTRNKTNRRYQLAYDKYIVTETDNAPAWVDTLAEESRSFAHQVSQLSKDSRHVQLALAYWRDKPYRTVEQSNRRVGMPDARIIVDFLADFDLFTDVEDVQKWLEVA